MVWPWGSNTDGFNVTNTRAFILSSSRPAAPAAASIQGSGAHGARAPARSLPCPNRITGRAEHPRENHVDVPHLIVEIERLVDLSARQHLRQVGILEQQRLEILVLVERTHGIPLHPLVGLLARDAAAREFEKNGARED